MLRLPPFQYAAPTSLREAVEMLAATGTNAMVLGGGTDILPKMKRRQQTPATLVGLRRLRELQGISAGDGLLIGAGVTLTEIVDHAAIRRLYAGLWQAAAQIATPHLRNVGTIGGNLCLDTRCNYYDQSHAWREAIDFCLKREGRTCWVATSSPKCLAVSSCDTAPVLAALGASIRLVSAAGERSIPVIDLYRNDGIDYLRRRPDEIVCTVNLPPADGWRSTYWKLRRRGAFDFPVLSVAAAAKISGDGTVEHARIVLGAVASAPLDAAAAAGALVGHVLNDDRIAHAADLAAHLARPMDNTDFSLVWRKRLAREFVVYALRELRGDDVRPLRRKIAHGLAG
jgi:4-hydroxybenzoyl-CoA reductase subunit beta